MTTIISEIILVYSHFALADAYNFHRFEILAYFDDSINDVRIPKKHYPLSSERVEQKERRAHSSFRLSPDSSGCRGLPSASSLPRAPRTQFLQHLRRCYLRRIAIGLWSEPTASPRRNVSIQITWRATRGGGRGEGRRGESEFSFPRGPYDTGETGETDVIISRRGTVFLHRDASPFSILSLRIVLRIALRTRPFVMPIICDIAKKKRAMNSSRVSFSRPIRDDLLKHQDEPRMKMYLKIRCTVRIILN